VLNEVGEYAATEGGRVAIEPISHREPPGPNTLALLIDFLEQVPCTQVGVVIDSAHETLDGAAPEIFAWQVEALAKSGRLHDSQASLARLRTEFERIEPR